MYTNNVTFENNYDKDSGAGVYADGSTYYSTHDKFINNYAKNGASIYGLRSIIEINNSTFTSNKAVHWSLIYGFNSKITVMNTVFTNISSKYATAIYSEANDKRLDVGLKVLNSKFINLSANATAGAIGAKAMDSIIIDGCSFINVKSGKNGGAVYLDINGNDILQKYVVTVSNSLFENCSSNYGGAFVQLGGTLNIMKTNFTNNFAEYIGGAAYLSNTTVLIGNSKFNGNSVKQLYGGALFIDDSESIITASEFMNNKGIEYDDAIYLFDSKYQLKILKRKSTSCYERI